jgi:hypothetical protein
MIVTEPIVQVRREEAETVRLLLHAFDWHGEHPFSKATFLTAGFSQFDAAKLTGHSVR